jgi:hypothetical protein
MRCSLSIAHESILGRTYTRGIKTKSQRFVDLKAFLGFVFFFQPRYSMPPLTTYNMIYVPQVSLVPPLHIWFDQNDITFPNEAFDAAEHFDHFGDIL